MKKLSIKEVMELPVGTKIHRVAGAKIVTMQVLVKHQKHEIFYFVSHTDYKETLSCYIPNDNHVYFTDYELAKEEMWNQLMDKVAVVNEVYFKNSKKFLHE